MDPTTVDDAEELYRSIRANSDEYSEQDGKFSSSAFDDREMTPSVDRSSLRTDPRDARLSPTDGVAKLLTADVRRSCSIPIIVNGAPNGEYAIDAIHRPIEKDAVTAENLAHCQIEANPVISNSKRFKKLKAALASLANKHGFIVRPT